MFIEINTSSGVPIYRQICDQVKIAVSTGVLNIGDKLPSVRALSESLTINPTTVQRAYLELETSGVIETRRGQGTFVRAAGAPLPPDERAERVSALIQSAVAEAHRVQMSRAELRATFDREVERVFGRRATETGGRRR